jgi:hypothetical protein
MDCIIDDQLWAPEGLDDARGLFAWGPPPPSFIRPDDLAAMMTGAHSTLTFAGPVMAGKELSL